MSANFPPTLPASTPAWVAYVTALLTFLLILDLLYRWLEPTKLQLRLTKEVFVRWIDRGEVVFANAVMLATRTAIVVSDVRVTLKRITGSAKAYPLSVVLVGEKVRGANVLAEHHFFSTSTLEVVTANTTHRRLYMCDLEEYSEQSRAMVADFEAGVRQIRDSYMPDPTVLADQETIATMVKEMDEVVKKFAERLYKRVQLEQGKYELEITAKYRRPSRVLFRRRTLQTSSKLSFEIREDFDKLFRSGIEDCLRGKVVAVVAPEKANVRYPQYDPYAVIEVQDSRQ
jgi:hypothetical protein